MRRRHAQKAQQKWRKMPLAERARFCTAAVDAMLAMTDEIAPELARQMGRPVCFGRNEIFGGFQARARHMIEIARPPWPILCRHRSTDFTASSAASRWEPSL